MKVTIKRAQTAKSEDFAVILNDRLLGDDLLLDPIRRCRWLRLSVDLGSPKFVGFFTQGVEVGSDPGSRLENAQIRLDRREKDATRLGSQEAPLAFE